MRAMIAIGMVPTATAGRIRCLNASPAGFQLPVIRLLSSSELEMKSMSEFLGPGDLGEAPIFRQRGEASRRR